MENLLVLNPWAFPEKMHLPLTNVLSVLKDRPVESVKYEMKQSDRHSLDSMIFDELCLTRGERDTVYEAIVNLVDARLKKAESV